MTSDIRVTPHCAVATASDVLAWWDRQGRPGEVLSAPEAERRHRLRRQIDRDDFVAARILVRWLLIGAGEQVGRIELRQTCVTCGGPHGRPEVVGRPDLWVSFAHSGGVVAAAACGSGPLGVDVELEVAEHPSETLPFSWAEWTRAEALVKAGKIELDAVMAGTAPSAAAFGLAPTELRGETVLGPYAAAVVAPARAIQLRFAGSTR